MTQTIASAYLARAFNAAHPDLPRAAGIPAALANERYVESLARVVTIGLTPRSMPGVARPCGRS